MMNRKVKILLFFYICLLLTSAILADGQPFVTPATAQVETVGPQVRQVNNVLYITGGIGEDETQALEAQKSQHNLWITNTDKTGAYLGDEHIRILNKNGAELVSTDIGPLFYATMPPGRYTLSLTFEGATQVRKITIGRKATNLHLVW